MVTHPAWALIYRSNILITQAAFTIYQTDAKEAGQMGHLI